MTLTVTEHPIATLVPRGPVGFDRERAEAAVEELLRAFGRDMDDAHLADTPRRVVDGLHEIVVMRAEHLCMSLRGARAAGTTTVTSAFRGELAKDAAFRANFAAATSNQEEPWRTS